MHTLGIAATLQLVEHVALRHNDPVMIWGGFGVGKTRGVEQLAERTGAFLCPILASQYENVDFRGLPDRDGDATVWLRPSSIPFKGNKLFEGHKRIIMFLDEITSASPAVMAVLYQLIDERRVGEHILMDNVRIVAAGNRDGDRGVITRVPMPLNNRMVHVEVIPNIEDWSERATIDGIAPEGIAFLNFKSELLHKWEQGMTEKNVPSPRSWYKALKYFADDAMPAPVKKAAIHGSVGNAAANDFLAFVAVYESMRGMLDEIHANPAKARLPQREDMSYALAMHLSGAMSESTVKNIDTYLRRMRPTFYVLAWTLAIRRDDDLSATSEFMDFAKQCKAVFQ